MKFHPAQNSSRRGITLIELMVVLVIAAVLASMAWPSFRESFLRSRRTDAMQALARLSQLQERWRANNPAFTDKLSDLNAASKSDSGYYTLSIESSSATGYTLKATVDSSGGQADDSKCQAFQLVVTNGNISYTSTSGGSKANTSPDPCWVK